MIRSVWLALSLVFTTTLIAQQAPYDVFPEAKPPYYRVRYEPSTKPGELIFGVNYTLWMPPEVKTVRGVIVHQHGCGEGSCKSGLTGAYDLHWQALAKKHACALLAPAYEQPEKADCQMWCDPRNGSAQAFQNGLAEFGKLTGHPELTEVPWALWGHSGGGHWAGGMVCLHPDRVAAAWLRSGVPLLEANPDRSTIKPHTLPKNASQVPIMCNPGTKEGVTEKEGRFAGVWPANETFFKAVRSQGGLIGVAVDPLTAHECGNQRYMAIQWLDACLTARLPDRPGEALKPMRGEDAWLAKLLDTQASPAATIQAQPLECVWLPNAEVAKAWMQYVKDTAITDTTPPPAPTGVIIDGNTVYWKAEADLQSGLASFEIVRDGKVIATVPEKGSNPFGRPVFQGLQYSDTPAMPLVEMRYTDANVPAGSKPQYEVIAINTVGLKSPPSQRLVHARGKSPNIVLFLVDDMGWVDCGAYGSKYYETPNIDRFAQRAMRFTNAYSQPLCSPTRASIMTGQYSARHKITAPSGHLPPQPADHRFLPDSAPANVAMLLPQSKNYLEPSQITLAETLKEAGYRTAHIGKWHLGITEPHWPERQGFDVAFHCHPDPGPPGAYFSPYGVRAPTETKPLAKGEKNVVGTITDGPKGEYIVDRQAEEAVKFISQRGDQPFFLNLWCYGVHGPWGHKQEYTEGFAKKSDPRDKQGNPIMASMLRSVDECFGRIMDQLESQGIADDTIVIFYSDNGGNTHSNTTADGKKSANADWQKWAGTLPPTNNAPLRDGKGTLYEGGTRVPLMWAWGNHIKPGSTSDSVVGPIDVYPTLLDLVGLQRPSDQVFDGVSYANVLTGGGALEREAYFNYHPHAGLDRAGGVWVRRGDWKLIRWFGTSPTYELFNLREDIGESMNVADRMPELVQSLNALIDRFLQDTGATYPRPNPAYQGPAATTAKGSGPKASAPNRLDPLDAWKQRGCVATLADGVMTVKGTGKAGTAFLGHAAGKMQGPATVELRLRSERGGKGRIDCLPQGANQTEGIISTTFEVPSGDWENVLVELKHTGPIGVMRLYLPADGQAVEIDQIEIRPKKGQAESWTW